ncbi:WGR domain-containing protein [Anabaena cylindrica FACHB-243]|uniref:WGR domain-containing protein n=1 Tax=Anabaena cylindrica (strain ATCC 27899 / PCC 7122) TaxID=272123 RepID=K9ZEZ8_ANACC|nr:MULTISPECIES: WGR domain-containing protein [Anabaena]AFZ57783.1 WGR domain-containing protein [Anabaena cylindrica PCC 7122]MBD2419307.1 WGR domain-containing protein [Anabaena cylindrica FACHB-243]MBY5281375.1 WGR domain-containing protein [Anabaena sp. CCAP 1446/1C]MBY5308409.1 WGR domain-containing protein [Anabaena sp. CCAP 1446/1C]MCM2408091.1 WGR domain-containing protein [Anabaena sp. CCAP 1446/1C]
MVLFKQKLLKFHTGIKCLISLEGCIVNQITFIPNVEREYCVTDDLNDQTEAENLYLAILRNYEPTCVSSTEEISPIPPITEALLTQKVYLELSDSKSHKFYEVVVKQTEVVINYGRIGTAGQSLTSTYPTVEKARLAASKKIHEKLKKGYLQTSKNKRNLAENKDLDISQFIRPAWKPLVKSGDDSLLSSKFGGRPWLAENESWPTCPCCGQSSSMQLLLQLNLSELPEPVTREYGNGLIQMFQCTSIGCQGIVTNAQVYYGRAADLVSNVLIRMISPNSEAAIPPLPQVYDEYEDFFPATTIIGWQEVEDYPELEDLVALIYGWDQVGNETLEDEVVERLGFEDRYDFLDSVTAVVGYKLGGYPGWAQRMEYPGCPICQKPMRQVFQLATEDDSSIPNEFGEGVGHILQCESHKHELVFVWAC